MVDVENAVSTIKVVSFGILVIVLVSPPKVIESPTLKALVKTVPEPVRVVVAFVVTDPEVG